MSEVREMTVKEMLGLLEWHEQMGRGDYVVKADPRGLCFLKLEHVNVNIVAPPDGETHNANPSVNEQKADQTTNPSNSGSTLNQNLNPDTPSTGRGQNKKAEDDTPTPQVVAPNITMNIDNTQTTASVLRMRRDEDGSLIVEKVAQ